MRHYVLDTSAFVKGYVAEPGERHIRGLVAAAVAEPPLCRLFLTDFTVLEALSAVLQKRDQRQITRRLCDAAFLEIERLLGGSEFPYVLMKVSGVVRTVPPLIRRHGLRPGDALHIAAALELRASTSDEAEMVFITCDAKQERAATAEGLDVWNPAL